jgi:hypothetical protein
MASIVSAGTTSATALNMSADTTGILQLASNNGTVGLTIDTSQNVGINNSSPTIRTKLMVSSSNASDTVTVGTVSGGFSITNTNSAYGLQFGSLSTGNSWIQSARMDGTATAYNLLLQPGGGLVGIGTLSPQRKVTIIGPDGASGVTEGNSRTALFLDNSGATYINIASGSASQSALFFSNTSANNIGAVAYDNTGNYLRFDAASAERGRFNSDGSFCVGKTQASESATTGSGYGFASPTVDPFFSVVNVNASGANACIYLSKRTTGQIMVFQTNNGTTNSTVGNISTAASSTAYNTSSDYRLKHDITPMTGALSRVALLKPVTYKWNVDNADGEGFIAHELAEVVPDCVSGEKDAMRTEAYEISPAVSATYDEEGNVLTPAIEAVMGERQVPSYQGIDTSFLVATLTAAIQELNAKVTSLEEQVLNLGVK